MKENEFGKRKHRPGSDYAKVRGYSSGGSHSVPVVIGGTTGAAKGPIDVYREQDKS